MRNIEKKVLELEPQSIESARKISSDIMDAAKKGFVDWFGGVNPDILKSCCPDDV